jgi:hypothetical protein
MNKTVCFFFLLLLSLCLGVPAQDTIDISVKGISDDKKDGAQKDRMEAEMDAMRQACEKAGIALESRTAVENFQVKYDIIKSRSKAVLLPGFQIIDIGYVQGGAYNVVLVGKIRTSAPKKVGTAPFHLILWLVEEEPLADRGSLLDKLYEWLNGIHGELTHDGTPLDRLEDNLSYVSRRDSALWGGRKFFAFTYLLPLGTLVYKQRTPNSNGSVSKHDFKIILRPKKEYVMEVAHDNAVYFNGLKSFKGELKNKRNGYCFPADFKKVYVKGRQ